MTNPTGVHPGYFGQHPGQYEADHYAADHFASTDQYGADHYGASGAPVAQESIDGHAATAPNVATRNDNPSIARFGLLVITAAVLLDAAAFFVDVLAGLRIVSGVPVSQVGFEYGSTLSEMANLALPAAVLVGGAAFLWWFFSCYRSRAARFQTRHQPIWAIVGWLIPLINFVRPPQIMSEMTRRSGLVPWWWALWAVGALIHVGLRLISPTVQRGWVYWQSAAFLADLLLLASLAIAFALVNEATHSRVRQLSR